MTGSSMKDIAIIGGGIAGLCTALALHKVGLPVTVYERAPQPATAGAGILMAANTESQLAVWRADPARPPLVYVRPRIERNSTFKVERVREYAGEGRRATREALDHWGRDS